MAIAHETTAVSPAAASTASDQARLLYEEFSESVLRFCASQLRTRDEAEEALQTTFLCALRALRRGVVPRVEAAWLFAIARNVCLSYRRSAATRGSREIPDDAQTIGVMTSAPRRQFDELIGLEDVLAQLPPTQRRAILLREWQGLSYREVAATLGLSQAAVETLIFRARRALAQGLSGSTRTSVRQRLRQALDAASVALGLKSAMGGSAAAKVAVTAAALTAAGAVAATAPNDSAPPRVVSRTTHQPAPAFLPTASVRIEARSERPATTPRRRAKSALTRQQPVGVAPSSAASPSASDADAVAQAQPTVTELGGGVDPPVAPASGSKSAGPLPSLAPPPPAAPAELPSVQIEAPTVEELPLPVDVPQVAPPALPDAQDLLP